MLTLDGPLRSKYIFQTPLHMAALLDNEAIASELILRAGKELEIDVSHQAAWLSM